CLARLLRHQSALETVDEAIQTARRLLTLDPLQEAVHRVLIRLHVRAGRREAALRQYEVCVGVLRRELQLGPEPETQQLHDEILKMREAPPPREESRPRSEQPAAQSSAVEPRPRALEVITVQAGSTEKTDGAPARRRLPSTSEFWSRYQAKAAS